MKLFSVCLFFIGLVFSGCVFNKQTKSASNLFQDFNLDEIVRQTNIKELRPETGGYSSSSGNEIRNRNFDLIYRIDEQDGKKFDEAGFISRLQAEVARKIVKTGVESRSSGGSGNESFYFSYFDDDNTGWIEIVGSRLEGNKYKLWCVIHENTAIKDEK